MDAVPAPTSSGPTDPEVEVRSDGIARHPGAADGLTSLHSPPFLDLHDAQMVITRCQVFRVTQDNHLPRDRAVCDPKDGSVRCG